MPADALMDRLDEAQAQPETGLAVAGDVRGGDGKITGSAPALDKSDCLLAGGVCFQDLGKRRPENRQLAEAALAQGWVGGGEEIARKDVFEKHGVSAQLAAGDDGRGLPDRSLQTAFGSGKNVERKVGQEWLFGHSL
jgi:hypothetical protein